MNPKQWRRIQIQRITVVLYALDIRELVQIESTFKNVHSEAGILFLECLTKEIQTRNLVDGLQVQPWDKAKREGEKT